MSAENGYQALSNIRFMLLPSKPDLFFLDVLVKITPIWVLSVNPITIQGQHLTNHLVYQYVHGNMSNNSDEKSLVEQCRKQNSRAQQILFDRYFNKMMNVCLRYLKNEEDAFEALNNAFLKVFAKINQYKSEGSLEGWIKKIVINSSIDFVRSNKSYRANFISTNEFQHFADYEDEKNSHEVSFDALDLTKEEIFDLVAELPPAARIVLNLYMIDEFSHRQIAENLKISEGTSRWYLSNARKILKEKIQQAVVVKNNSSNHG